MKSNKVSLHSCNEWLSVSEGRVLTLTLTLTLSTPLGAMPSWTTLPQHLREQGWLTLGVGKYFHDTNRGLGVLGDARYPGGAGNADP